MPSTPSHPSSAERPVVPGTLLSLIAWLRQGAEVQGQETKFPFPWFSDKGEELNPAEELAGVAPEIVHLIARIREYGQKPRIVPRGTQLADIYGLLERFAPMMLAAAARAGGGQRGGALARRALRRGDADLAAAPKSPRAELSRACGLAIPAKKVSSKKFQPGARVIIHRIDPPRL